MELDVLNEEYPLTRTTKVWVFVVSYSGEMCSLHDLATILPLSYDRMHSNSCLILLVLLPPSIFQILVYTIVRSQIMHTLCTIGEQLQLGPLLHLDLTAIDNVV